VWPGPSGCGKTFLLDGAERVAVEEDGVARDAVFRDYFKPVAQKPRGFGKWSDVAESLVKDVHDWTNANWPLKNTIIKVLRLAVDRYGPGLLQPVRERALSGSLSGLPDLLHTIARTTQTPAIVLLDDIDHAQGYSDWIPLLLHDIYRLGRVREASFVIAITTTTTSRLWTDLHNDAAWSHDWALINALRPLDLAEVGELTRLPASVVENMTRSTGGIPRLVVQELEMLRQMGDLTQTTAGEWTYAPREIDFTDFDRFDRGARQTDATQTFIREWYTRTSRERDWPAVVDDVLSAAALEGTVFTLEPSTHSCWRRRRMVNCLPSGRTSRCLQVG
jgi:hypothetical protein